MICQVFIFSIVRKKRSYFPYPIAFLANKKRKNDSRAFVPPYTVSRVYISLEVNPLYVFLIFRFQDRKQVRGSVWIIAVMKRTLK